MLFTMNWLNSVFPDVLGKISGELEIKQYTTDSRIKSEHSLFIPIIGEQFDGHQFVKEAYENGAIATLWDRKKPLPEGLPEDFIIFLVDDTTEALQYLAMKYREEINPIVIGITGSNGKTTTKDIVASIVKKKFKTHFTDGNFNNELGLPFTILSMKRDTEVLVLEMGMSSFGEIELLSLIAKPDYAIITNIGESHIEFLGSRTGIAKAKLEIISGLSQEGKLIIDGDEELLSHKHDEENVITVGFNEHNDFTISNINIQPNGTSFRGSDNILYDIPLLGSHHAKNAAYGIVLGQLLGINQSQVQAAFQDLNRTGMRFEMLTGKNQVSIINDAYNASPTSMIAAINVVENMEGFHRKVLVLGDIYELGNLSRELHESVSSVINEKITTLFTIGEDSRIISDVVKGKYPHMTVKHFEQKQDVVEALQPYLNQDTLILFKASRGLELETVIEEIK